METRDALTSERELKLALAGGPVRFAVLGRLAEPMVTVATLGLKVTGEARGWQRQHARKYSDARCNHQQQTQAKSAYGCGQDKCADAERSADQPDGFLVKETGAVSSKK